MRKPSRLKTPLIYIAFLFAGLGAQTIAAQQPSLDPLTIPKFKDQLPLIPVWAPTGVTDAAGTRQEITITATQLQAQVLPSGLPRTTVWGYSGMARAAGEGEVESMRLSPGGTFEAVRHLPIVVQWVNGLTGNYLFPVDPTLDWANPSHDYPVSGPFPPFPPGYPRYQGSVAIVTHLHGGETEPNSDGGPMSWFTADGRTGPDYTQSRYTYTNRQPPTTMWYHNHTMGVSRLTVSAGLVGMYILRDPDNPLDDPARTPFPSGRYEIPLILQDKSFNKDGSLFFPSVGDNPATHPYWAPEFFGTTNTVNGKVWPNLNVERRAYRFRILNGSNARFYNLSLSDRRSFVMIGSDGGYLPKPVTLTHVLLAPAERADIIVDFSTAAAGSRIILMNDANTPFPDGDPVDPATTAQVMQLTVGRGGAAPMGALPDTLNVFPTLTPDTPARILAFYEIEDPVSDQPLMSTLDGQAFSAPVSERPRVGSTEDWKFVNLTDDAHPIHLHLVQFLVVSRQQFDKTRYTTDWLALNGTPPLNHSTRVLAPDAYFSGDPMPPDPSESGWKDTVRADPGFVTTIRVRFAPIDAPTGASRPGDNLYSFDATEYPGYVWHCHILDHEDNEMMRPYILLP